MKTKGNGTKPTDWHRADVISALKKKGLSLASLSRAHGLHSGSLYNALMRPWPKGERIIAQALGLNAVDIWPSRYVKGE
jgi:Ner family transcriptional regulator